VSFLLKPLKWGQVSFTGSIGTGKKIALAALQSNMKRVTLELGGKSPSLVFADANLDVAVKWCTQGIVGNCGQVCIASSRVYVEESISQTFLELFKKNIEESTKAFGDPQLPTTVTGSLADEMQMNRVLEYMEKGKKEASLITGGERLGDSVFYLVVRTTNLNRGAS
jgi:aldehyde dehydrogenase (NAD+)